MNCSEADVYVSAVCDGERIPEHFAHHIARCGVCRRTLNDYSRIGAELRLAAATESAPLPPLLLRDRHSRLEFWWRRVYLSRFALVGLIASVIVGIAAMSVVRAQSKPLWFEFGYAPDQVDPFNYVVAQAGFDDTPAFLGFSHGNPIAVALRIKVESISSDDVVLRVRAVPARIEATANRVKLLGGPVGGVSLARVPSVHYKAGESLPIPIEGGGTLYLKGDVLDHQPKIAFGRPLVPAEDTMNIRWPVLVDSNKLIAELRGASSTAYKSEGAVFFSVPAGVFTFALRPFPGAVQGEANWGEITFKFDGTDYRLLAAAPITGGDQPRPIWVRREAQSNGARLCSSVCLGSGPLPK